MRVLLDRPWLTAFLPEPLRLLGWAPHNPGFVTADRVIWREVRDEDLTEDLDALAWLSEELQARGEVSAVGLLTSRDVTRHHLRTAQAGGVSATCLATVGLTNAERVGRRQPHGIHAHGTINILVTTDAALSDIALIELSSIATQARTAAVMEHGPALPAGRVTGTGTDCIVVGARPGDATFAGLHTEVGEAVGAAVHRAVAAGVVEWMDEQRR